MADQISLFDLSAAALRRQKSSAAHSNHLVWSVQHRLAGDESSRRVSASSQLAPVRVRSRLRRLRLFVGAMPPARHSREELQAMFDMAVDLKEGGLVVTTDKSPLGAGTHWLANDIDLHARGQRQPEIWSRKAGWLLDVVPPVAHCFTRKCTRRPSPDKETDVVSRVMNENVEAEEKRRPAK